MLEGYFQLVVHHSGTFCDARYVGGDTSTWSCDGDRWSYFEILDILYESIKRNGMEDAKKGKKRRR